MSAIVGLFWMVFHAIEAGNYEVKPKQAWNNAFSVESLQEMGLQTLSLM